MDRNTIAAIIGFAGGAFSIIASIFNWDWFFENRKAYFIVKIFGRTGARVFYSLVGLFLIFLGLKITNIM